jgi:predicted GNAT superfamily acetyltransferase
LKLFQREEALSRGIKLVEWTFDPLEVKNAHFNFGLGAIAGRYLPNLYGVTTSPLHAGLPTDRLVGEWRLDSARVRRAAAAQGASVATPGSRVSGGGRKRKLAQVRIPAEIAALKASRPDEAARVQAEVRQEFEHWFAQGYAATAIETGAAGSTYVLEPWARRD